MNEAWVVSTTLKQSSKYGLRNFVFKDLLEKNSNFDV